MKYLTLLTSSLVFLSTSVLAANDLNNVVDGSYETIEITVVEMKGKPPYKRYKETVRVTDVAALESTRLNNKVEDIKGRSPLNLKM